MECFSTGAPVSVPDLADAARRWPVFVAAVAERGAYRSVHALPLRLRGEAIGALNLFHGQPSALPDTDLAVGQALADVATIGILQERTIRRSEVVTEQLQTALNSRVIIEQAKGVLAQHGHLTWTRPSTGCAATPATTTHGCPRWPARSSRPTSPPTCSTHPPYGAQQPTSGELGSCPRPERARKITSQAGHFRPHGRSYTAAGVVALGEAEARETFVCSSLTRVTTILAGKCEDSCVLGPASCAFCQSASSRSRASIKLCHTAS
jgi:hypothetical protein